MGWFRQPIRGPASASGMWPGTQAPQGQRGQPLTGSHCRAAYSLPLPPCQHKRAGLAAEGREGQGTWQLDFVFGLENPICRIRVQGAQWEGKLPVKLELQMPRLVTRTGNRESSLGELPRRAGAWLEGSHRLPGCSRGRRVPGLELICSWSWVKPLSLQQESSGTDVPTQHLRALWPAWVWPRRATSQGPNDTEQSPCDTGWEGRADAQPRDRVPGTQGLALEADWRRGLRFETKTVCWNSVS